MKKGFISLAVVCQMISGCGLPTVDFEMVSGRVIGRETCNTNDSLNALLISLDTNSVRENFGRDVSFNGRAYKNVVKTYSPEASRLDSARRYSFMFYQTDVVSNPICNLSTTNTIDVPQIKLKEIAQTVQ
ncbi:hypothetical protein [Spirosoma sordidisoli]|uniref:Uncharacterized protein n=1 Tax=Spirosoma sordidisoli TaxID=2502893 RepID=A0A4V1RWF3_9BACT|nr:hypothetical protein [Spirosoma sordidisoli]RYC70068.1 hypothetical protein EQG79_09360 [Spirosoma sordidisoli]